MSTSDSIIMYGAMWCGDCRRAKKFFDEHEITFTFIDVDQDAEASQKIIEINGGYRSIPTIIFPDDTVLIEPSNAELAAQLNITDFA